MESIYEYGARAGFWRLHRFSRTEHSRPFMVSDACAFPVQVRAMQDSWEIASHGLKWLSIKTCQRRRAHPNSKSNCAAVTGERPYGLYTGRCSENTVALVAGRRSDYISDTYADDLPYWMTLDGGSVNYSIHTDANDMRFAAPGFNQAINFFNI